MREVHVVLGVPCVDSIYCVWLQDLLPVLKELKSARPDSHNVHVVVFCSPGTDHCSCSCPSGALSELVRTRMPGQAGRLPRSGAWARRGLWRSSLCTLEAISSSFSLEVTFKEENTGRISQRVSLAFVTTCRASHNNRQLSKRR